MNLARFLAGALVLHAALYYGYAASIAANHEAFERDRWFLEREPDVHVLVVGDSHARSAVQAVTLDGVLNLATRGEDYFKNRNRLDWLMARRPDGIDTVVLGFDAASFSPFHVDVFKPEYVWGRYVDFAALGRERGENRKYLALSLKAWLVPYAGEAETILQYVEGKGQFRRRLDAGGGVNEIEWGKAVAARHFAGGTWDPHLEAALRGMIADLRARGIRVVLVSYPVTDGYREAAVAHGADPARRKALLDELLVPGQVDHLDYETLAVGVKGAFLDGDHLSDPGGKVFTRRLARDLVTLGVLPAPQD